MGVITLYHYTDKEGKNAIVRTNVIRKSSDPGHAAFGDGVYFTAKGLSYSAGHVAINNWGDEELMLSGKTDYVIKIVLDSKKVKKVKSSRNIYLHKGDLHFDDVIDFEIIKRPKAGRENDAVRCNEADAYGQSSSCKRGSRFRARYFDDSRHESDSSEEDDYVDGYAKGKWGRSEVAGDRRGRRYESESDSIEDDYVDGYAKGTWGRSEVAGHCRGRRYESERGFSEVDDSYNMGKKGNLAAAYYRRYDESESDSNEEDDYYFDGSNKGKKDRRGLRYDRESNGTQYTDSKGRTAQDGVYEYRSRSGSQNSSCFGVHVFDDSSESDGEFERYHYDKCDRRRYGHTVNLLHKLDLSDLDDDY